MEFNHLPRKESVATDCWLPGDTSFIWKNDSFNFNSLE